MLPVGLMEDNMLSAPSLLKCILFSSLVEVNIRLHKSELDTSVLLSLHCSMKNGSGKHKQEILYKKKDGNFGRYPHHDV